MKLVLQCAMCGTHHPVGTAVCSTCRASGVTQLRLMFECQKCGDLGLNPTCGKCPAVVPLDLDDDLIVAEELPDEPIPHAAVADDVFDLGAFDLSFELDEEDDEAVIVDLSEDEEDEEDEDDDLDDVFDVEDDLEDDEVEDEFDEDEDDEYDPFDDDFDEDEDEDEEDEVDDEEDEDD